MSAPAEAERLIKDAFYDARNAGSTMDAAAATAVKKLSAAGLLAGKDVDFPNDPAWWLDWSNELTQLIPDGDESRYSNPEGAQESIVTDCFTAYRKQLDEVGAYVAKSIDNVNGLTCTWENAEVLELMVDVMNLLAGREIGTKS